MPRGLIDGLFSYNKLTLQKQCKGTAFSQRMQSPKIAKITRRLYLKIGRGGGNYELGIMNYEGVCAEGDALIIPIIHYYICVGQIFFVLLQRKQQNTTPWKHGFLSSCCFAAARYCMHGVAVLVKLWIMNAHANYELWIMRAYVLRLMLR